MEGKEVRTVESWLLTGKEVAADTLILEGWHKPGSLTLASGAWMHAAGSALLEPGTHPIRAHDQYVWLAVEEGSAVLTWHGTPLTLETADTCFLPAKNETCALSASNSSPSIWAWVSMKRIIAVRGFRIVCSPSRPCSAAAVPCAQE